jgi:hypothetical protein
MSVHYQIKYYISFEKFDFCIFFTNKIIMFEPISLSMVPSKTTLGLKLTTLPDFCSIQSASADQILLTTLY